MRGRTEGAAVAQWQCGCGMLLWCNWIFQVKTEWIIRLKIQTKICFQARSGPRLVPVSINKSVRKLSSEIEEGRCLELYYIILHTLPWSRYNRGNKTMIYSCWLELKLLHCGRGHTYILSRSLESCSGRRFVTGEAVISLLLTSITSGETSLTRLEENTFYSF